MRLLRRDKLRIASAIATILGSLLLDRAGTAASRGTRLQSPASQSGAHLTASSTQTTIVWPAGSNNFLDFDWYVDSEESFDFLRVYIDGVQVNAWSGLGRTGHVLRPMSAGSHTLKFEYYKDVSVNRGRDLAWVDNIVASANGRIIEAHHFDSRAPDMSDWAPAGFAGGIAPRMPSINRIIQRPQAQAFSGFTSAPSTSRIQRTLTWPAGASANLSFNYLVDSEANYDFLKVFVDGVLAWQVSGDAWGSKRISVTPGTHTIAFEYYKDTSVDTGRDVAAVGDVVAATDEVVIEEHSFEGQNLGWVPDGWTGSGVSGGWSVSDPPPIPIFVARGNPTVPPAVDGEIALLGAQNEYAGATRLPTFDEGSVDGPPGTVFLRESEGEQALFVAARVHSATTPVGGENGEVIVRLDAGRPASVLGLGCGRVPGPEDRRIRIAYSSSSSTDTSLSVSQESGTCQGPWVAVPTDSQWPLTAVVKEALTDPGFLHIELRITLRPANVATSSVLADGKLGFSLTHRNLSGKVSLENVPTILGGVVPEDNVLRWATIDLASPTALDRYDRYFLPSPPEAWLRFIGVQ